MATLSERLRHQQIDEVLAAVDEAADALDAMEAAANDILGHNNETSRERLRAALAKLLDHDDPHL